MQSYNTGPVYVYVGVADTPEYAPAGEPTPVYLGVCERSPQPSFRPEFQPIHADVTGAKPYDMVFLGEDAVVSMDLTVYNEAVYQTITMRPRYKSKVGGVDPVLGQVQFGDIGTMMLTEGYTYPLWLHFPYHSKFGDLPKGYRFVSAYVMGPDNPVIGTQPNKRRIQFHCLGAYDQDTGGVKCHDDDFDLIPSVPPTSSSGALES